jgi:hypothetical protein
MGHMGHFLSSLNTLISFSRAVNSKDGPYDPYRPFDADFERDGKEEILFKILHGT